MKKMKLFMTATLLLSFSITMMAQTRTVTGRITSYEDGAPIPEVSVRLKGGITVTQSNADGIYSIAV
ncbi:MAG TPA: hypothetical protein ENN08_04055, partial [Bacteroidales bacterium]|nr:hypothetical protein [Bacteroidales bacterium]